MEDAKVTYKFKLTIKEEVLKKMEVITSEYHNELAGLLFGTISKDEININDIIFPPQVVGAGSVDIDEKDILKIRKDNPNWKNFIGLWHSHRSMGTFWSGGEGDESHIKFLSNGKDISVFIVSSFKDNKYEHKTKVEIKTPLEITFDDIPLVTNCSKDYKDKILSEIKNIIRMPKKEVFKSKDNIEFGAEGIQYVFNASKEELSVQNLTYTEMNEVKLIPTYDYKTCWLDKGKWNINFPCISMLIAKKMRKEIEDWMDSSIIRNNQSDKDYSNINQKGLYWYGY